MPLSALKFQFFTNYHFPAVITRTHTHTQTHSVFPTHNASKNAHNTFFIKLLFFCSLLLLLTPETLPCHLFRQTNDQKWSRKLPKRTKINFLFFIIYFTFSLSLTEKNKTTYFSALFIIGNRKTARKNVPIKIFLFFFFFTFFASYRSA